MLILSFHSITCKKIVAGLTKTSEGNKVPSIVFTKGGALWLEAQSDIGADALGLDWTVDIGQARAAAWAVKWPYKAIWTLPFYSAHHKPLKKKLRLFWLAMVKAMDIYLILATVLPNLPPPENAACMLKAVREMSKQYHT